MPFRIGLVIDTGPHHFRGIARGVHAWAREHAALVSHRDGALPPAALVAGVDAMITTTRVPELRQQLAETGVPFVVVSGRGAPGILPMVLPDDRAVGRMAAEHLRLQGYRRLAMLETRLGWFADERRAGFAQAATEAGGEAMTAPDDPEALRAWLREQAHPVGLFTINDHLARGLSELARDLGIAVPDSLGILGADDDPWMTETAAVELSSVALDSLRQGRTAADLAWRLAGGHRPSAAPLLIPPRRVMVRRSTDVIGNDQEPVAALLRLMRSRDGLRLEVPELCRRCGLNRRTAERALAARLGSSPAAELQRVRLELAAELLEETTLTLADIATACGYASGRSFQRAFARERGMTAGDWRHQHGQPGSGS